MDFSQTRELPVHLSRQPQAMYDDDDGNKRKRNWYRSSVSHVMWQRVNRKKLIDYESLELKNVGSKKRWKLKRLMVAHACCELLLDLGSRKRVSKNHIIYLHDGKMKLMNLHSNGLSTSFNSREKCTRKSFSFFCCQKWKVINMS